MLIYMLLTFSDCVVRFFRRFLFSIDFTWGADELQVPDCLFKLFEIRMSPQSNFVRRDSVYMPRLRLPGRDHVYMEYCQRYRVDREVSKANGTIFRPNECAHCRPEVAMGSESLEYFEILWFDEEWTPGLEVY